MTSFGIRLRALLLAVLFAAGNLGLSVTDVLLDHGLGTRHPHPRPHYEAPGGCHDRAEHCILGRLLGELRLQPPACTTARLLAAIATSCIVPPQADLAANRPANLPRSRAPPPSFA